jgi:hypothetical protein
MILANTNNSPIAAPGTDDKNSLLEAYRAYSGNAYASLNDLYALMTTPGGARDAFVGSRTAEVTLIRSRLFTQVYNG